MCALRKTIPNYYSASFVRLYNLDMVPAFLMLASQCCLAVQCIR